MLIHCQNCRALLNTDLEHDSVSIPEFVPLQELEAVIDLAPVGYYALCGSCRRELKVSRRYAGQSVMCKFCNGAFLLAPQVLAASDFYAPCPHCSEQLRVAAKYVGAKVACKFCQGKLNIVPAPRD